MLTFGVGDGVFTSVLELTVCSVLESPTILSTLFFKALSASGVLISDNISLTQITSLLQAIIIVAPIGYSVFALA